MAAHVLDFDRDETIAAGYLWRDAPIRVDIPEGVTVTPVDMLDVMRYDETILDRVLVDSDGQCYRIIPMEYAFLKKYNLPLPTVNWTRRIHEGLRFQ